MTMPPQAFSYDTFSQSTNPGPVKYLGSRYDAAGNFLTERGNTIVRHIIPGSKTEEALVDLREKMRRAPCGDLLAFTDVESLHMTLFNGVIETARQPDTWPETIPRDADVEITTEAIRQRLVGYRRPGPFAMRVVEVTPFGLTLAGATEADEQMARAWRDSFPPLFGYKSNGHDNYVFHTTMAYLKGWLPDAALPEIRAYFAGLTADFKSQVPLVELGPPCFCSFEDMNWFEPLLVLPGSDVTMPTLTRPVHQMRSTI
ncbi:MAG: DUF1868 domain-containing protein [Pseudomonadota bacterium]